MLLQVYRTQLDLLHPDVTSRVQARQLSQKDAVDPTDMHVDFPLDNKSWPVTFTVVQSGFQEQS